MQYVGMMTQIRRNNLRSVLLLLSFPLIILATVWVFLAIIQSMGAPPADAYGNVAAEVDYDAVNRSFVAIAPWVVGIVGVWFLIAYFANSSMVRAATGARPLTRRENPRVYNIVENLCMTCNMDMPQINIVNDPQLNAFASGINKKTYTVTLTTGIMDVLSDEELEGVIAHELTHIRNRDTRVLIISIVFVGILSTVLSIISQTVLRTFLYGGGNRKNEKGGGAIVLIGIAAVICSAIAYFLVSLTRFAISRKREFMADAGGAEMTRNPRALASALRKISADPGLRNVGREDVAQLFIIHPGKTAKNFMDMLNSMFSTHPSTEERIRILEQF